MKGVVDRDFGYSEFEIDVGLLCMQISQTFLGIKSLFIQIPYFSNLKQAGVGQLNYYPNVR
jgi:hypothetical protein